MSKDTEYDQTAPAFANSSNRRYNFYTSRKSESSTSRPESRQEMRPESRSESRKSQPRTFEDQRSSDLDLDSTNELEEIPSSKSFLKDFQARKNRIANTTKKYEKYKSYTDQITKLTSKYSRNQLSPDSDFGESKLPESVGSERQHSITPTPPSIEVISDAPAPMAKTSVATKS
jgi:hypothetical protein